MKYIIPVAIILLLGACDGSSEPTTKIASTQLEALEKAKNVDQLLQQSMEEMQQKIDENDN